MKKRMAMFVSLVLMAGLVLGGCGQTAEPAAQQPETEAAQQEGSPEDSAQSESEAKDTILIGLSQPTNQEARYKSNTDAQQAKAEEIGGIELIVTDANNDSSTQATQIENMISKGIDVLIVCPCDGEAIVPSIEAAKADGIPVVVWGREAATDQQDVFINYDWTDIGRQMGKEALSAVPGGNYVIIGGDNSTVIPDEMTTGIKESLKKKLDSGEINIVFEQYITNWAPDGAMSAMENALTQQKNDVDAVICHNDGMAGGAVQALAAQGLAGEVPVIAMDAEVSALERVHDGTQHSTVQFDFNGEGEKIMSAAYALATGQSLDDIVAFYTDINGVDIPTANVPFFIVTKDNLKEVVIDGGFKTMEEVYANIPKEEWPK